jgi:hypothetical protein
MNFNKDYIPLLCASELQIMKNIDLRLFWSILLSAMGRGESGLEVVWCLEDESTI